MIKCRTILSRTAALALALTLVTTLVQLASASPASCKGLIVDLGYAKYRGYFEETYALNVWKRYVKYLF